MTPGVRQPRTSNWPRLTLLSVGLILGVAIGTQARAVFAIRERLRVPPVEIQELGYRFHAQERFLEALEEQVRVLRLQTATYLQASAEQLPASKALNAELSRYRILAGLTPLEGLGVIVEVSDSPRLRTPRENPNEWILHNYDVLAIVNELWSSGAEAIAINGERIVANTPIRSGTTFMVNARRIVPPLQITAIGDSEGMAYYVLRRGGYLDYLRAFGFPVQVIRAKQLTIPVYSGTFTFKYLRPQPGGSK